MAARPLVAVRQIADGAEEGKPVALPAVFLAPIRLDIVNFVHTSMNKNKRQPYATFVNAGHQHSAESWGTGRAVSRIPRVSGGGTSRAGQAAFGNMCRKGRMFAPTKTWRKWHKKINTNQKRFAVASALAASALPALVMARGHHVENVPEIPLVADNAFESLQKTKKAAAALQALGAYDDVEKSKASRKIRCGVGKQRNRRHVQRRGPLVVYKEDHGIVKACRNLPGVDLCQVSALNLLQLAPGGHLGRFVVWTRGAFEQLNEIWGSNTRSSTKKGYHLPRPTMTNSDLTRLINSDEIQSKVRPARTEIVRARLKKNPLKNFGVKVRLNPYAAQLRKAEQAAQARRAARRAEAVNARRGKKVIHSPEDAAKIARNKTHDVQQKLNYRKLIDGASFELPKLKVRSAKDFQ